MYHRRFNYAAHVNDATQTNADTAQTNADKFF
jgi:hypothetical protein